MPVLRIKPGESLTFGNTGRLFYASRVGRRHSLEFRTNVKSSVDAPEVKLTFKPRGNSLDVRIQAPVELPVHRYTTFLAIQRENNLSDIPPDEHSKFFEPIEFVAENNTFCGPLNIRVPG